MDVDDQTSRLPEDVLANVLRRLAPRWLAASRGVCRCWRAAVDGHGLLRAVLPLLPRSVAGIFMKNSVSWMSLFLCRPSTGPAFSADLRYTFVSGGEGGGRHMFDAFEVLGHCNGLVLLPDRVVNPATRQWTRLPPRPPRSRQRWRCTGTGLWLDMDMDMDDGLHRRVFYDDDVHLVFDPATSPHFEVYCIPRVRVLWEREELESPAAAAAVEELEWPPSPCILQVFSSETGQWEERSFAREGPDARTTTVADMRADTFTEHRYAAFWRGALYVQCQTDFIMRLTLSSRKYKLIQPPAAFEPFQNPYDLIYQRRLSIGKSKKGVYCVLIDEHFQMKVWILDDSNDVQEIEWVPKQLGRQVTELQGKRLYRHQSRGRWRIQPISSYGDPESEDMVQERFDWDSDNDDLLPDGGSTTGYQFHIAFLGFHPYKEVIFLNDSFERVLAYHLDSSKMQDLGYVYPEDGQDDYFNEEPAVHASFPYTPCWMGHGREGDFPKNS